MTIEQFTGSLQAYEEKKKRDEIETIKQLLQLKLIKNSRGHGRGHGDQGHGGRGEVNTGISQNLNEPSRGRGGQNRVEDVVQGLGEINLR